ncbi:cytochrome c oxidase subunit II [Quisquiliibacterium transsilvanicum]|uniref:Cytochrome c oxidase subunit 2 n=1 Tax=Quisquiliibacterium transsilvanicum TaxID=1549638 RepID=A0A7W8HL55_9BURK|nr:cytochrome c oxidase subunit 2 [Quisquiliibacterium transsilvanicum]
MISKKIQHWVVATALSAPAAMALATPDMPGGPRNNQWTLTEPATRIAADQIWIHGFLMWICAAIFVAVFGVMFYSIWKHRKSKGHKSAEFHESTAVEIAWTIVPFIIVIGMALPATRMVVEQKDTSNADITVKATGYQWKWGYDYLRGEGEGIAFLSALSTPRDSIDDKNFPGAKEKREKNETYLLEVDNPLVVPVGKKVRVVITANDVIHSWYVPALGVKQDAIPGFVRDTWFKAEQPGIYRGACAELCGKEHAFMPIVVEVKSEDDYRAWVEQKKKEILAAQEDPNKEWEPAALAARGEKVYASNCASCHQPTGAGMPPTFPALKGSQIVLGPQDGQLDIVLKGKAGTAMSSFKQLSDTELAAVITYTRNAWGNQPEDNVVQPGEVLAARGK